MVSIAVLLCVLAGMIMFIGVASTVNGMDDDARLALYASLVGVAVIAMGACGFAMFVILFPKHR